MYTCTVTNVRKEKTRKKTTYLQYSFFTIPKKKTSRTRVMYYVYNALLQPVMNWVPIFGVKASLLTTIPYPGDL